MAKQIVLAIPDLHIPYQNPDAFDFLADVARKWKPTKIVCLGDEADFHGLSFHPKHPNLKSAGDEHDALLVGMKALYKMFPSVQVCTSNHTSRPFRVAFNAGLPNLFLRDYREFMQAPKGWAWRDRIIIDEVVYEHGEGVSGRNAAWQAMADNKMSTVIGHIHSFGGVTYSKSPFKQTFAMNAGCLIDPVSLAFAYGNKYRNKATLGCGIVCEGVEAHFIRMK